VKANQAKFAVSLLCSVLGVSRSGYYAWLGRGPSARDLEDRRLTETVVSIHKKSKGTYGVPRVHAELKANGEKVGANRVRKLMVRERIKGVTRRRGFKTTIRDQERRPAPDLVQRDFTATGRDELWVADITYVPTLAGFLFLAVVLDVWSRRIVGWAMRTHLRTELVEEALDMALEQRQPASVIHHSDQGTQYTSIGFGKRCAKAGVRPSMGSVGDCYDCDDPACQKGIVSGCRCLGWPDPCYDRLHVLALTCRPPEQRHFRPASQTSSDLIGAWSTRSHRSPVLSSDRRGWTIDQP